MKIDRRFTKPNEDIFDSVEWTKRSSRISNLDGSTVFEMRDAEVPASWSQLATDIVVSKYFRKSGVPQHDGKGQPLKDDSGASVTGPEKSVRQVVHRLAACWQSWGSKHGYFDSKKDADAFYDEVGHMLLNQMCAPNSPQWFNTGLNFAYGISGPAQGHWVVDPKTRDTKLADDAYTHPQPHACFIQSIDDDLVNAGGIMDLWVREARLFKYGSGTGTNFSKLRGEEEPLSGGGRSSGLMSWLKIGDRAAGAIKSGGTTRRAAKMVCLDLDHPDIESFINWKVREELKVAAMAEGFRCMGVTEQEIASSLGLELDYDFNGEGYQTISGQNSNNSVRITNEFFKQIEEDSEWQLIRRTDGKVAKTLSARKLWDQISYAAWRCADPGVQFDTTINEWHTCPESGRINASNPCSEYMFLDNTACNLASLNLLAFYDSKTGVFDIEGFEHGVRLWTIVLEISVLMASFPSRQIAQLSYEYRTLGLGYANIGAMLMQAGVAYNSPQARAICGAITSILTGRSYATSAEMARQLGPFPGYFENREHMLRVIRNHRRAAHGVSRAANEAVQHELGDYELLEVKPVPIDEAYLERDQASDGSLANSQQLLDKARIAWDEAFVLGRKHGYRNAQVSVIAPTGTIGLLMDCDTTGVEPDFALVKFKKLAGGGYFKIANQSLKPALQNLGYSEQQITDILTYVMGRLSLDVPMPGPDGSDKNLEHDLFTDFLQDKGLNEADLEKVSESLPAVFDLCQVFNEQLLGAEMIERLGLSKLAGKRDFDVLSALGLGVQQVQWLNTTICGTQTVEGAPHLAEEHLPIFDCASTCGPTGTRFIPVEGHIRMMAASQPFISGAISKTINLPNKATVDDIQSAYQLSWELGLKANALYRDGCKLSQPLNATSGGNGERTTVTAASSDSMQLEEGLAGQDEPEHVVISAQEEVATQVAHVASQISDPDHAPGHVEKVVERVVERPMRRRLPDTRTSLTHKFSVAGHEGYLTVGLYDDGTPGELFITMAKEGSTIGGLMDSLGTAISVALQYGVPIEQLVVKFTHQRFEPAGMTHNPDIPFAKSLVDYIFRWMGMQFIPGYRAANAPRRSTTTESDLTSEKGNKPEQGQDRVALRATASADDRVKQDDHPDTLKSGSQASAPLSGTPQHTVAAGMTLDERGGISIVGANADEGPSSSRNSEVGSAMAAILKEVQADAPPCDVCGTITVRNGTCYKCLNCGNSMGCS